MFNAIINSFYQHIINDLSVVYALGIRIIIRIYFACHGLKFQLSLLRQYPPFLSSNIHVYVSLAEYISKIRFHLIAKNTFPLPYVRRRSPMLRTDAFNN